MSYLRVKDVAKKLNITPRSVQDRCKRDNLEKDNLGYKIPVDNFKGWLYEVKAVKKERSSLNEAKRRSRASSKEDKEDVIVQEFTKKEYDYLDKLIHDDHPVLLERTKQQELRIQDHKETINILQDNLKLANHRLDVLTNAMSEQHEILNQNNTLKLIDKTEPKRNK